MSEVQQVIERMNNRFTSGNSIPVERAVITAKEWEILEITLRCSEALYKKINEHIDKHPEDDND